MPAFFRGEEMKDINFLLNYYNVKEKCITKWPIYYIQNVTLKALKLRYYVLL